MDDGRQSHLRRLCAAEGRPTWRRWPEARCMCHWDPRHRPLLGDGPYVARFQEKDLVWDQQFEFAVRDPSLLMTVAVFDAQHHDEFLGLVRVRVGAFRAGRWEDSPRCPLYVRRESRQGTKCRVRKRGTLLLAVRWQPKEPKQIFMRYIRPVIPEYWYLPAFHDNEIRLRGHQRQLRGYYLSHSDMRLPAQASHIMYLDPIGLEFSFMNFKANFTRCKEQEWVFRCFSMLPYVRSWRNPALSVCAQAAWVALWYRPLYLVQFLAFMGTVVMTYKALTKPPLQLFLTDPTLFAPVNPDGSLELSDDEEDEESPTHYGMSEVREVKQKLNVVAEINNAHKAFNETCGQIMIWTARVADFGERCHALLLWQDPRASALVFGALLVMAVVPMFLPVRMLAAFIGVWSLRPPWMHGNKRPPVYWNILVRMPTRADGAIPPPIDQ